MIISNITDCQGSEAQLAVSIRFSALFPRAQIVFAPVSNTLEAAGHFIRAFDAALDQTMICVSNVAPRGDKKKHNNGAPFCFAYTNDRKTVFIGPAASFLLLRKLGIISKINETAVFTVCRNFLGEAESHRIANSQFRGYEYLPRLANWIWENKKEIPIEKELVVPKLKGCYIWHLDKFSDYESTRVNCKTTALEIKEISDPRFRNLPFYDRLTDVPKGEAAITRGSSGYGNMRFLEIVIQGKSAAETFGLRIGSMV